MIDVLTLNSTFSIARFLRQKVFGLDRHTSQLIGVGSSIYGATAMLAAEPMVKAEASGVTAAITTVVISGAIAIFLYPTMYLLLTYWFSPKTYDIYIGSAMHKIAQVTTAGHTINPDTENATAIAKTSYVMMLVSFPILLTAHVRQLFPTTGGEKSKVTILWFAIPFVVTVIFNSFHLLS